MSLPALGDGPVSRWLEQRRRPRWPDLRAFLEDLERRRELVRIPAEVDCNLEITAFCRHSLRRGGPARLFKNVRGYSMPVLGNVYGTIGRITRALGLDSVSELRELGRLLAAFRSAGLPDGLPELMRDAPEWARLLKAGSPECPLKLTGGWSRSGVSLAWMGGIDPDQGAGRNAGTNIVKRRTATNED